MESCTLQVSHDFPAKVSRPVEQLGGEAAAPVSCTVAGLEDFTGGSLDSQQSDRDPIDDPMWK